MSNQKVAVFCKVKMLDDRRKVYRFPNDLQSALLEYASDEDLNDLLVGALINVPTKERFKSKKYTPTLHVAKIENVFLSRKCRVSRRTRGQFLTLDRWTERSFDISFLLHDHSFLNKTRIFIDMIRWKLRRNEAKI